MGWVSKGAMVALLSVALLWGLGSDDLVAQEPSPPFRFSQADPIKLSWTKLKEESVEVEVLNDSTKERSLKVELGDLGLKAAGGGTLDNSEVVKVQSSSLMLKSAGSNEITLRATDSAPAVSPDIYDASLAVYEEASDTVIRRAVQL